MQQVWWSPVGLSSAQAGVMKWTPKVRGLQRRAEWMEGNSWIWDDLGLAWSGYMDPAWNGTIARHLQRINSARPDVMTVSRAILLKLQSWWQLAKLAFLRTSPVPCSGESFLVCILLSLCKNVLKETKGNNIVHFLPRLPTVCHYYTFGGFFIVCTKTK